MELAEPQNLIGGGSLVAETESTRDPALLEQYKILVQSAEEISARRASANNYMLSVNSLLVAVHGVGKSLQPDANWQGALPFAGFLICISWAALIKSYRNVNSAKFGVIHELEAQLPAQPYKDEWEKMSDWHVLLSYVEQGIPFIFAAIFFALLVRA